MNAPWPLQVRIPKHAEGEERRLVEQLRELQQAKPAGECAAALGVSPADSMRRPRGKA